MKQSTITTSPNGVIIRFHNTRIRIIDEGDTFLFQFRMFRKEFTPVPGQIYDRGIVMTDMRVSRMAAEGILQGLYKYYEQK